MADRSVRMDVRLVIASWPEDAPRGAVRRFCVEVGMSESWFFELRRRCRAEGPTGLVSRSRRPVRSPSLTAAAVEDLAVRVRKELADQGWDHGPISVRSHLLRRGLPAPSRSTLARIFTRRGLVVPAPQKRPRSSWRRFVYAAPNACWQLDGFEVTLADGTIAVALHVLDDHSRRILASLAAPGETSAAALSVVRTAIDRVGVPQRFLSDNGSAFNPTRRGRTGQLERWLSGLGVEMLTARPAHPQTCGKSERSHSTFRQWQRARRVPATIPDLQADLDIFEPDYNTLRPHQGIGGQTPMEAWTATPVAPPPTPPTPTPEAPPRSTVERRRVGQDGDIHIAAAMIRLGAEYIGSTVLAHHAGDEISIFTPEGLHVRTVTLDGRRYYPSGKPPGGRRKTRKHSTMS